MNFLLKLIFLKDIKRRLRTLDSTLFIFDNVEDRSFLKDYLPEPSTHHHVLITTRDSSIWPSNYHIEQLKSFSEEEAIEYIQKNVSWAEMSEMKELANLFGNHPLGLSQGTAYIKENDLQIPEYIDYYKEYKAQMLQEDIANDPHMSGVYTTLSMAVDSLSSKYGKAVELLKLCAYLHADAIPEAIFYSLFESESERLKAIASLKTVSLISVAQGEDSRRVLYIHRLLQEVIKIKTSENAPQILLKVAELVEGQMPDRRVIVVVQLNHQKLKQVFTILDNYAVIIKKSLKQIDKEAIDIAIIRLYLACIHLYLPIALYNKIRELFQQGLSVIPSCEREYLNVTKSFQKMARVYFHQGDYVKAIEVCEESLRIRKAVFGSQHLEVVDTLNDIATTYFKQGDLIKSLEKFEESLTIRKAILGLEHPDVDDILGKIANLYFKQGNYAKALESYEESLTIRKVVYGPEHSKIADTLNNMAMVYFNQTNFVKALKNFKEALRIGESALGSEHPDVIEILNNIAMVYDHQARVYYNQGSYAEALECNEEILRIRKEKIGFEHPAVATILNNIGYVYLGLGDYVKALINLEKALQIRKIILGPEHQDVISISKVIKELQDELDQNQKNSEDITPNKASSHQPTENSTIQNQVIEETSRLNEQALQFRSQGEYDKALEIYEKVLLLRCAKFPFDHWSIASTLYEIATIYQAQDKFDQALEKYTDILQRKKAKLGVDHPDIAEVLRNIIAMEDTLEIAPNARISVVEMKLMSDKKKNETPLNNKKKCVVS